MTSLQRRLIKIEEILHDASGLIPYSEKWLAYWGNWTDRLLTEPDFRPSEKIPLEALDALLQLSPDSQQ